MASFREEEEEEKQEGRFSAITFLQLKAENVIVEHHGVSLHLCPLTLEGAGEESRVFSASGVHPAVLQKIRQLVLFLVTHPGILPAATEETNPAGCLTSHIFAERSGNAGAAKHSERSSSSSSARS